MRRKAIRRLSGRVIDRSLIPRLSHHLQRPSPAHGYRALGTKLLAAETADAVAVPDLELFPRVADRALRAVALADAAPDALRMVDHRPRGQGVLEKPCAPTRAGAIRDAPGAATETLLRAPSANGSPRIRIRSSLVSPIPAAAAARDDVEQRGIGPDERSANHIQCHRVRAGKHQADLPRIAATRTVPFHSHDRIHDGQAGLDQAAQLDEHPRKSIAVDTRVEMPLHLSPAGNAAEEVFHRAGERHHAVGLELRDVDDRVRFEHVPGDLETVELPAVLYLHGLVHLRQRSAFFLDHVHDTRLLAHLPELAEAGAVAHQRRRPGLAHEVYDRAQDLGMRNDRFGGKGRLEQVGLDQHPVAGLHERAHAAEQIDRPAHRALDPVTVVISALYYRDVG